jgi:choline-sulfatase
MNKHGTSRRDFLKAGGMLAAAGAIPQVASGEGLVRHGAVPAFAHLPGFGLSQPNFLIIMVDEMRYPPVYESNALKRFRRRYLRTQDELRRHGVEFHRHYAASTACAPSRTSFWTGQYPSLHGVTNTTGAAKEAIEHDTFWLDPGSVPTMGDYFRAAGYRTYLKGKWHVSYADMPIPGTHEGWPTYDDNGTPLRGKEALYEQASRLEDFGFSGWIGPEPHGNAPLNSGSSVPAGQRGRDVGFAQQAANLIAALDSDSNDAPWLVVSSFVNPHDIALYGLLAENVGGFDFSIEDVVPNNEALFNQRLFNQSLEDDLSTKPSTQASYQQSYWEWMQPVPPDDYFRYYYQLHKNVDADMMSVYQALRRSRFFENTVVLFTSDHGDLLGSHNYMHQKWYQTYDESLRVPLIISNPILFPENRNVESLTSHIDMVPTMLGLAGIRQRAVRPVLARDHSDTRKLVGRNLRKLVLGQIDEVDDPLYFMTDDDPSRGLNMNTWYGITYNSVIQPNHIESVITKFDGKVWKYTRYFDNPQFWSNPAGINQSVTPIDIVVQEEGPQLMTPGEQIVPCKRTVKTDPVPEEFEMYNVSDDPMELNNLYGVPEYRSIQGLLASLLVEQCARKRLTPKSGTVPSQPPCNGPA